MIARCARSRDRAIGTGSERLRAPIPCAETTKQAEGGAAAPASEGRAKRERKQVRQRQQEQEQHAGGGGGGGASGRVSLSIARRTPAAALAAAAAQVERLTVEAKKEDEFLVPKGSGTQLRDIPNVAFKLGKIRRVC